MIFRWITFFILLVGAAYAQQSTPLRIGLKESPPFTFKNEQGQWEGVTISLWEKIARDLGKEYIFEERDLKGLLKGVTDGTLDASIGALTITSAREEIFDFSHSFYTTGLGVVTRKGEGVGIGTTITQLLERGVVKLLGIILIVLISISAMVWFFEWLYVQTRPKEIERARDRWGENALVVISHYAGLR